MSLRIFFTALAGSVESKAMPSKPAALWTDSRNKRVYELTCQGRGRWVLSWEDTNGKDWGIGMGQTISQAFKNAGIRWIPEGFPRRA